MATNDISIAISNSKLKSLPGLLFTILKLVYQQIDPFNTIFSYLCKYLVECFEQLKTILL